MAWEEARPTEDIMVESSMKSCLPGSLLVSEASFLRGLSAYVSKVCRLSLLSLPLHSHPCTCWAFRPSPLLSRYQNTCLGPTFPHPPALVLAVPSSWYDFCLPPTDSSRSNLIHLSVWPCAKDRTCFWLGLSRQCGEEKQMGGWKDRHSRTQGPMPKRN